MQALQVATLEGRLDRRTASLSVAHITSHIRDRLASSRGVRWDRPFQAAGPVLIALFVATNGLLLTAQAMAAHPTVSVIVRETAAAGSAPERSVRALGGQVGRRLPILNGFTAELPSNRVTALARTPGVAAVTQNARVHLQGIGSTGVTDSTALHTLSQVTSSIGARSYWAKGFTGKGIDIALIDSGVSPVPGLDGAGKLFHGPDLSFESQADNLRHVDTFAHGTHMASIMAGRDATAVTGSYASDTKNYLGVAPDARVVSLKVADAYGNTDVSQVIAAISWIVQNKNLNGLNVRVLSLSFGTDSIQGYVGDPLSYAAEMAWRKGIVVVASGGNHGYRDSDGLTNPAHDPYLLAVGATDMVGTATQLDDRVASFSARGVNGRNPDIVAPGKSILGLRVPNSQVDLTYPGSVYADRYTKGSGTSQATAAVAGAAALILQQRPTATPDQVKKLLMNTATPLTSGLTDKASQGAGEINLAKALTAATPKFTQTFTRSQGTGSLEGSRGTAHITDEGVELRGEQDIFGVPFNSAAMATAQANLTSWSGGTWNGTAWTGAGWSGNRWSSTVWSGNRWSGGGWSSVTYCGNTWSGNRWSDSSWSGNRWSSSVWSGNTWSHASWE